MIAPPTPLQERIMYVFAQGHSIWVVSARMNLDALTVRQQLIAGCKAAGLNVRGRPGPLLRLGIQSWFGSNVTMADDMFQ